MDLNIPALLPDFALRGARGNGNPRSPRPETSLTTAAEPGRAIIDSIQPGDVADLFERAEPAGGGSPLAGLERTEGRLRLGPGGAYSPAAGGALFQALHVRHEETSFALEIGDMNLSFQAVRETIIYEQARMGLESLMGPGSPLAGFGDFSISPESIALFEGMPEHVQKEITNLLMLMRALGDENANFDKILEGVFGFARNFKFQAASVDMQIVELNFQSGQSGEDATADPLVIDLDGDGVELTGVERGASFDIDADGTPDRVSVPTGGDAFLALDRDGDGRITSGAELFGDLTGATDGFRDLARFDLNLDGRITPRDPVFDDLLLFRPHGTNSTLAREGIDSLNIGRTGRPRTLPTGDILAGLGIVEKSDGSRRTLADVLLRFRPL